MTKKAFVTISFGSTFEEARTKDIGGIEEALKEAFPHYDHYRAYTSSIVRRILTRQNIIVHDPDTVLKQLIDGGYTDIVLQPTHLLHGEEFEQKILTLKDKYASEVKSLTLSTPLIAKDADFYPAAAAIAAQFGTLAPDEGIILMGHGSPRQNNQSFGRTYVKLQQVFDDMELPVVVGTVEDEDSPNLNAVLEQLQRRRYRKVHMYPLMVVAGDHARNDMYGEKDSWKTHIEEAGITTVGHLYGLGRNKAVQAVYINHALQAMSETTVK